MTKILFVLPSLSVGGLERVQVTIANALAELGAQVTILILQPNDELSHQLDSRVRLIYRKAKSNIMRRVPYVRHKFFDDGMWETRVSARTLYKYYVGDEKYDVEIGFFRGLSIKIISGSTNPNSIKLAWVHSDFRKCKGIQNNFRSLNDVKKAYERYDRIICVSEQARRSFVEVIGLEEKTSTIYNMVPEREIEKKSLEKCPISKETFTILSVGRLAEEKGYDRLLSVVRKLKAEGYTFELWLVGEGAEANKLKQYADEEELNNVKFIGKQINPYCYMRQADLYVCSSKYEGYNLTVAEAMLCGIPILSTKCSGPCEILENGKYGMLVENDEKNLYRGLKELIDDEKLLEYYRKQTKERAVFLNQENILKQILEIIKPK